MDIIDYSSDLLTSEVLALAMDGRLRVEADRSQAAFMQVMRFAYIAALEGVPFKEIYTGEG